MSTKTTFKRVALVAVAALGLGVVSTVSATAAGTVYTTSISVTTDKAPVAGSLGTKVVHTVRFSTSTTTGTPTIRPAVILTAKPASSVMALQAGTSVFDTDKNNVTLGKAQVSAEAILDASNTEANGVNCTSSVKAGLTYADCVVYLHAYYDLPGTYTYTLFDDASNDDGIVNGTDFSQTFSVVVGASSTATSYAATVTVRNASTVTAGTNGSLVKINLTSAGAAAQPDSAGGIKVSLTGTAKVAFVNAVAITTPSTTYILGRNDFDGNGNAWINVTNAAAETVVLTLTGSGSVTTLAAPAPVTITTVTEIPSAVVYVQAGSLTGIKQTVVSASGTNGAATASKASTSAITLSTGVTGATAALYKDAVTVTDTNGGLFGLSTTKYDILVSSGLTTDTYAGTFTVTPAWTAGVTGQTFSVSDYTTTTNPLVVTSATAAATTLSVSAPTATLRAVIGSPQSFTIKAVDQFGLVISNVAISATIAGRNSTVNVASCITVAGLCSLTYTDASTSTTSMIDTLTFAGATTGTTATVTYSTLAGLGVSTVLATTTNTSATTGADLTTFVPFAIAAGDDGVEAGVKPVTITVKDANGVGIQGVPVTVSVAGAGAAVLSTKVTVYTNGLGVATSSVYAWLAPVYGTNYVVTATAGGVSDTVNTYWGQANADHTRTFTATNSGRVITVIAKDRLGNPVSTASFTARITAGDGFFGTGTNVATGTTDATGMMKFVTLESPTDLTVVIKAGDSSIYAQTDAPAGNISTADPLDTFTAATAGTATTAETGVGATFAPAGINTATVTIVGAPSATEATSQAAVDAAAEATDAANAATDAANAAAEAADAATAAAQDAADAVAALSTQVSEMVTALKKQITALTNLVIKIQKKVKA